MTDPADRRQSSLSRRDFTRLALCAGGALAGAGVLGGGLPVSADDQAPLWFASRGAMVGEGELLAMDWPARAKQLGLNLLDLTYLAPSWLTQTDLGEATVAACADNGLDFEYGLHICSWALPRELFDRNPEFFRMNESGVRTNDANLCVHSPRALEIVAEHVVEYISPLRTTTGRYMFWIDDAQPMCRCPQCRAYSDSDQALILEHAMLKAARTVDPRASLCHLAYTRTLPPPTQVKPEPGIFLQFAPIERVFTVPLSDPTGTIGPDGPNHGRLVEYLDANLEWFGKEGADVLEYWLDNSRFSGWRRDKIGKVPWNRELYLDDLRTYARRGIRSVRTYAFWFDKDYVGKYGEPPIDEYAEGLLRWREVDGEPVEV